MNTSVDRNENTVTITTVVDGAEWENAQKAAFKKRKANLEIKGFRRGQVPDKMAKRLLGNDIIYYDAANAIAQGILNDAIDANELKLVDRPVFDYKDATPESITLTFTCTVEPEVKLGEYKGFGIQKENAEVTEEEVNEAMNQRAAAHADMVLVEDDTPAASGDEVTIDFTGTVDGEEFEGGSENDFDLVLGSNTFIPGFEDQIVGMITNETKDIVVTFPEDYLAANLAGKEATFKTTVKKIEKREVPEMTDELVKEMNIDGVETVEALREKVTEDLKNRKERAAEEKFTDEVIKAAADKAEVEFPAVMIDDEVDNMFKEFSNQIQRSGFNAAQYLAAIGSSEEEMKEKMRDQAAARLKNSFVLEAVADAENLNATEEEVDKALEDYANMFQMNKEQIKTMINPKDLANQLRVTKAIDFLKANQ